MKALITALALVTLIASPTFAQRQYPGESGQKDYNQGYPCGIAGTMLGVQQIGTDHRPSLAASLRTSRSFPCDGGMARLFL